MDRLMPQYWDQAGIALIGVRETQQQLLIHYLLEHIRFRLLIHFLVLLLIQHMSVNLYSLHILRPQ